MKKTLLARKCTAALAVVLIALNVHAVDWWRNVPVFGGGDVTGAIYNHTTGELYLRTNVGGAWRLDRITGEWIPMLDYIGQYNPNPYYSYVLSLAADPVNTENLYVAVGGYLTSGNGAILASTDDGKDWTEDDLTIPVGANANASYTGERLQVDPNLPSMLYFASQQNGLWINTASDTGNWNQIPSTALPPSDLNFICLDRSSGSPGTTPCQTMIVGVQAISQNLYITKNGGANWSPLPDPPGSPYYPVRCALDEKDNLFYVCFCNDDSLDPNNANTGSVWCYNISASHWTTTSPLLSSTTDGLNGSYGLAGFCLDPENPSVLMAATMIDYDLSNEIFRSINAGTSWNGILKNDPDIDNSQAPYVQQNLKSKNWITDVEINPINRNEAIFVTGYGVYMTENLLQADANNPVTWIFSDMGLEETVCLGLISPPSGNAELLTALGDVAGFAYDNFNTSPPAPGDYSPFYPTTTSIDFAQLDPSFIARSHTADYTGDLSDTLGAYSTDGGVSWTQFANAPSGEVDSGALAVAADGSTIVWTPGAGTYYSTDLGAHWYASAGGMPQNLTPVADRANGLKFYAYDAVNGNVWASTDGGMTFSLSCKNLPTFPNYNQYGASLKAVFGHEGELWLTGRDYLWHSSDSGQTFNPVHPEKIQGANQVGFGMAAPGENYPAIYLAGFVDGVAGIFESDDEGANWTQINDDKHQFGSITAITGDPRIYGRVYVGTGGRGTLYADPVLPMLHLYPVEIERQPGGPYIIVSVNGTVYGLDYFLQRSDTFGPNATNWVDVATNAGISGAITWTNALAGSQQFYRVKAQYPQ